MLSSHWAISSSFFAASHRSHGRMMISQVILLLRFHWFGLNVVCLCYVILTHYYYSHLIPLNTSICHSHKLSVPSLRPPRCFLANPPWKTSMECQSAFPKRASEPGPNCVRCTAWMCPIHQWTAAAASCPGAWPLHHPYTHLCLLTDMHSVIAFVVISLFGENPAIYVFGWFLTSVEALHDFSMAIMFITSFQKPQI